MLFLSQLSPKHTPTDKFLCIYTHHGKHYLPQVDSPRHKKSNPPRSKWLVPLLLDPCLFAPSLEIWTELFRYFLNNVLSVEKIYFKNFICSSVSINTETIPHPNSINTMSDYRFRF